MAYSVQSILNTNLSPLNAPGQMSGLAGLDGTALNRTMGMSPLLQGSGLVGDLSLAQLQLKFQTEQLSVLLQMLMLLMQNRGINPSNDQSQNNPVDQLGSSSALGGGGGNSSQSAASGSSASSATSSSGELPAVERQGHKIGAKIAEKFDQMVAAAAKDGVKLQISSGLRTHAEQQKLYQAYLNGTGNLAAKPGTSNHESGEAIDFANTSGAHEWLRKNAARFGFHGNVPGEPWHYSLNGK